MKHQIYGFLRKMYDYAFLALNQVWACDFNMEHQIHGQVFVIFLLFFCFLSLHELSSTQPPMVDGERPKLPASPRVAAAVVVAVDAKRWRKSEREKKDN
uniref:Uncharacterized protein n=1 Tax=Romanomermis culicivorax TaxID=13658 RepID=A0A915J584_ROMCU